ncbi:Stp1/IreP family PP2C-type Ser/Thr phosphatase [Alloacidobacterium dinghuense]|uniref:Stp1/IreP family PP2C-type Ser/Thr phosphatase n=1 Tax=Alloacidobacterium dinghuense TaxID=2763107 RepID=A0A7G8BHY9_9BACT|nr:Stp1/IreP family PP2C-type Ser/Thr phosphatase [Alloacidobacterium dinghuense]QNI32159.1 Stp1/IreP family PP2C-type Ser/Thr phosphatase [Alloacidobacterium dinghuense]
MPQEQMLMEAAALTDVGRIRSGNEDSYGLCYEAGFFVVCDGMGGAAAGEVASQVTVAAVMEKVCAETVSDPRQALETAIAESNRQVFSRAERESSLHGMGTTLVALLVREGCVWIAHVGDSRCYRLRAGALERMTQDHSLVDEQIRLGQMTPEEAEVSPFRNVITRAIGTREHVTPDIQEVATEHGDLFLLCSDGLTKEVPEPRMAELLCGDISDLQALCQALIQDANDSGGSDNITAILVRIS